MGNLLGSPVTVKETHMGETKDEKLKFGLSSMQGWRVHMEDAHIAEGNMYALKDDGTKIPLKGHALFAVYDGHGGTFAAIYSGNNFLRILSKQKNFIEYAKLCQKEEEEKDNENEKSKTTTNSDGDGSSSAAVEESKSPGSAVKNKEAKKLDLLEKAFKQAFVETDYEIALAIRGKSHPDANSKYHPESEGDSTAAAGSSPSNSDMAMKASSDHVSAVEDEGDSGTTACVVLITPDSMVCANAGDSRAIFARRNTAITSIYHANNKNGTNNDNKAVPLSFDHKPDDEAETRRIRSAGGYVAGGRVEGDLAVSRGLGDFRFKQMAIVMNNTELYPDRGGGGGGGTERSVEVSTDHVATLDDDGDQHMMNDSNTCSRSDLDQLKSSMSSSSVVLFQPAEQKVSPIPDIIVHTRQHTKDEYVVVACDGIWDVLSNQQAVSEIDHIMYADGERNLGLIAEEILDSCLRFGSKDNMTAIVIQLPACEASYDEAKSIASTSNISQDGVLGRRRKRDEQERKENGDDSDDDNDNTHNINLRDSIVDATAVADAAADN